MLITQPYLNKQKEYNNIIYVMIVGSCLVHFSVLKADQSGLLKFPVSPLSCSLGPPLGSALLPGPPGLSVGSASHHLPLDLHLRGKLEPGAEALSKNKKGRRSRTVFTELQLMGLEKRFEKQKYLSTPDR